MAEVHDATAIGEVLQSELLGLVPMGQGGRLLRGETTIGGRIPINPSGGLRVQGPPDRRHRPGADLRTRHAIARRSGARQVQGARIALAENGGGLAGVEEAVACLTLLGK